MSDISETPIWFGRHENRKIKDIEAGYLLWWYSDEKTVKTRKLMRWIHENRDVLEEQKALEDAEWKARQNEKR